MIRLAISVEGRTEEEFVKEVLADHLRRIGVEPTPILIGSAGGDVTINRLASDMAILYWSFDFVTSLVDFYGFRGKGNSTPDELQQRIDEAVGQIMRGALDQTRIFSYVQQFEFEGLLFSDTRAFAFLSDSPAHLVAELEAIRARFPTPEDIDDGYETAPSKRIAELVSGYQKVADGPLLAMEIGLDAIRAECPRFNAWLTRLERLAVPPARR